MLQAGQNTILNRLEDESLFIFREIVAECERPVLLYSIGKDSSVLLHLARKAFYPALLPFPLLHIDTGWKFREMIAHRDQTASSLGLRLIVYRNPQPNPPNPFDHGAYYTHAMKTEALKQALIQGGFDAAFGGARRDEERSRAKERIVSLRNANHGWSPADQRPEFGKLFNTRHGPDESLRIFPLSNWTEGDVWLYIQRENIPLVPLYFAAQRKVVERHGQLIMVHDERMRLEPGEVVDERMVRFRSLGCYPLTGAMESTASTLDEIVAEILTTRNSERASRLIDQEVGHSMERKKREGYF